MKLKIERHSVAYFLLDIFFLISVSRGQTIFMGKGKFYIHNASDSNRRERVPPIYYEVVTETRLYTYLYIYIYI